MREKEENRRTQESFVGNLKKSVLFNEREQERRAIFGGRELSSILDMLTLNEYFKEDRATLFFGGLLKEVFHQAIIVVSRSLLSINFIF